MKQQEKKTLAIIKSSHATQFNQVHMLQEHWSNAAKKAQRIGETKPKKKNLNWMKSAENEKKGMKTMFGKRYPNCVKKTKKEEVEHLEEMPYQVIGSPDGKKEKKIGKPVKSRKYADARASELADTHKKTGGKYRSQYVEKVEIQDANGNTFAHVEDVITNEDLMSEDCKSPSKNRESCRYLL